MPVARWWLHLVAGPATAVVLASASAPAPAAQPPAACVRIEHDARADRYTVINDCATPASVAYCSVDHRLSGERCGERRSAVNPYYTHMMTLEPGAREQRSGSGTMRFAACPGRINAWAGTRGSFSSTADGRFTCWPGDGAATAASTPRWVNLSSAASAASAGPAASEAGTGGLSLLTSTATNRDLAAACRAAQAPVVEAGAAAPMCDCHPLRDEGPGTGIYRCEVRYLGEPHSDLYLRLKELIRKSLPPCDPAQAGGCLREPSVGPPRG